MRKFIGSRPSGNIYIFFFNVYAHSFPPFLATINNASHVFHGKKALYNVIPIPSSGNCLFLSFAYFWEKIIDKVVALKLGNIAVKFVSQHEITSTTTSPLFSVTER